jgi:endonuclease-3 related protein
MPLGLSRLHSSQGSPLASPNQEQAIRNYYHALYAAWGEQHWWPGESQFEVIVGAYLTQNTAWINVERALGNLRAANVLSVESIRKIRLVRLERLIRPSGYFRQKAKRIKRFVAFLDRQYGGSLEKLFSQPTQKIREHLLSLNGVGPETADSILLYAGNHPVFVVDAYTRRVLDRHNLLLANTDYEDIRQLFERALQSIAELAPDSHPGGTETRRHANQESGFQVRVVLGNTAVPESALDETKARVHRISSASPQIRGESAPAFPATAHSPSAMSTAKRTALVQIYNEMHGLLVGVGKHFCGKSQPKCDGCPLQPFLPAR